jgi:hypothetical protein
MQPDSRRPPSTRDGTCVVDLGSIVPIDHAPHVLERFGTAFVIGRILDRGFLGPLPLLIARASPPPESLHRGRIDSAYGYCGRGVHLP